MKKLLFVNSKLSSGGSERVMTLLANALCKQGFDVTMAIIREDINETYSVDKDVKVIRFFYGKKNKAYIAIKRFLKLRHIIKYGNYDDVISFMYDVNMFTLLVCLGLKQRVIVSERNNPDKRLNNKIKKIIECSIYKKAFFVVIQTEDVKRYYTDTVQKKCIVIPNPVNPLLPEPYVGSREKVIVAVGRLTEQKNFILLLDGFSEFKKVYHDYRLLIFGDGVLKEKLKKYANKIGVSENVDFAGYVSDVNERMRKAAMYVSTSDYEGISNSMIEALSMGMPVICTDCPVGGARMMIKNNVNGILIPVGNKKRLVDAMKKIAKDTEYADRLSTEAKNIRELYSIDNIIKKWIPLF